MRMTKDADVWLLTIQKGSSILRHLPVFVQNAKDGDAVTGQLKRGLWRKPTLFKPVDIAGDGCDRSNLLLTLRSRTDRQYPRRGECDRRL